MGRQDDQEMPAGLKLEISTFDIWFTLNFRCQKTAENILHLVVAIVMNLAKLLKTSCPHLQEVDLAALINLQVHTLSTSQSTLFPITKTGRSYYPTTYPLTPHINVHTVNLNHCIDILQRHGFHMYIT